MGFVLLAIVVLLGVYIMMTYNGFISLRNRGQNAWADIDVQLKRRHDLIPNLVETVKGYAGHESKVFEEVARLRSGAIESHGPQEQSGVENMLTSALKTLFAVAEAYPELKADQNFRELQSQLSVIEDNIQSSRRYYNAIVRDLNTKREMFPSNLVASAFNIEAMQYFQIEEDQQREPVQVKFT